MMCRFINIIRKTAISCVARFSEGDINIAIGDVWWQYGVFFIAPSQDASK